MPKRSKGIWATALKFFHNFSIVLIGLLAISMVSITIASAIGIFPWLDISARFGDTDIVNAGMYAQLVFTGFCIALAFYIPSNARIMTLENSHRSFHITMKDVEHAYRASFEGDRRGMFKTGSEFDSVRERIAYLREHPDLATLEPAVLEVASQMSHESRELAELYSEEKIDRARLFLKQRQEEIETYQENIRMAQLTTQQLKNWQLQVETEEGLVEKQLDRLEADLAEILPAIGMKLESDKLPTQENVVLIARKPKQNPTTKTNA